MNRILRCPDCNTPLVPGSSSCIKCNKQFSKPIPKVAEPKPADPLTMSISGTPIATPPKSAYKPQGKVVFTSVLVVACLIALVTFVINQSQANERQAVAQKQAYQQVLQDRTQLQQPPTPVSMPAPVVMTAPSPPPDVMNEPSSPTDVTNAPSSPPDVMTSQQGSTEASGGSSEQQGTDAQQRDQEREVDAKQQHDELDARKTSLDQQIIELKNEKEKDKFDSMDGNHDSLDSFGKENDRQDAFASRIDTLQKEKDSLPGD